MICPACGAYNEEGRAYCDRCRVPLSATATVPAPVAEPYGQGPFPDGANPVNPGAAPGPYGIPPAAPLAEGCVAAAWHDVKATPGWFGKMMLLGLVNVVPILNFVVQGYSLQWAREAAFGRRSSMPSGIFENRAFPVGFFAIAIALIFGLAFGLATGLLGLVTFGIGTFVVPVLWVFFIMFMDACIVRMAVVGRFGGAFDLAKVWGAYKRSLGALFCASCVPSLIAGLLAGVIVLVAGGIVMALGLGGFSAYYGGSSMRVLGVPLAGGMVAVVLIGAVLSLVLNAFAQVVKYRALGHWVARVAPEWAYEAEAASRYPFGTYFNASPAVTGGASYSTPEPYVPPVVPSEPVMPSGMPLPYVVPPASPARQPQRDEGTTPLEAPAPVRPTLTLVRVSGERFVITDFPATVGKGSAANVRIDGNSAISRAHVRIALSGASFIMEDLGATNGTYLNGNPLSEGELAVLGDGDELRLGDESFTIEVK